MALPLLKALNSVKFPASQLCRRCICSPTVKTFCQKSSVNGNVQSEKEQSQVSPNRDATANENLDSRRGGFARSFEKFTIEDTTPPEEEESFATMLRNSKIIDLGDPEGKLVVGTIYHIVEDDLYIDFGWKFPCVCTRPVKFGRDYVRGAKVLLALKDLELSTRFLGAERDLTLLEADAKLAGLLYSPARARK